MIRHFFQGRDGQMVTRKYKRLFAAYTLTIGMAFYISLAGPVSAMPGDGFPKRTSPVNKSKSRNIRRRDAKSPTRGPDCPVCEQIESLNRRVEALSHQLEANSARPVEDVDGRREIAELKAQLKEEKERATAAERANELLRTELTQTRQSTAATEKAIAGATVTQTSTGTQVEELAKKTSKLETAID